MSDFNITLFEACELLNRSKKSISRYIRRGLLHPERVKSQQGTLEYRFSKSDIEDFKAQEAEKAGQTRQDTADKTEEIRYTGHIKTGFIQNKELLDQTRQDTADKTGQESEVITLLKETMELLRDQLKTKDEQISSLGGKIDELIERDRETNIILKGLQDKVFMLEQTKPKPEDTRQDSDQTGQDKAWETGRDKTVKKNFFERVKNFIKGK